ncbi:hypothetical protein AB0B94_30475 [Micromonospora sp. NPDC048986]|uniref:hypothetical protein n=1 Tax=Micromonospora sp. NPDC048986 TaxID=3155644 RepID=UPI0033FF18A7
MTATRPAANRPMIDLDAGSAHQYGYRNPLTLDGPGFTTPKATTEDHSDDRVPANTTGGTR